MPAGDAALIAVADRGARHIGQRGGARIAALVDVQVDVEVVARGEREQTVEQRVEVVERRAMRTRGRRARHGAEDAAGLAPPARRACSPHSPRKKIDRHQRHALQRDAALPFGAHVARRHASCARPVRARNRGACGSPRRRARRRSAGRSSCARCRSSWVQRRRSACVAATASANVPLTLGERTTVWPRSRWVCTSISIGQTCRPCRSTARAGRDRRAARRDDARDRAALDQHVERAPSRRRVLGGEAVRAREQSIAARARCGSNTRWRRATRCRRTASRHRRHRASAPSADAAAPDGKFAMSRSSAMKPST